MNKKDINALHKELCKNISDDNTLKELQQLAKQLDIPYNGLKKAELCDEIATYLFYARDETPTDDFNPYNFKY